MSYTNNQGIQEHLNVLWYVTKNDGEIFVELVYDQPKFDTPEFNQIANNCNDPEFVAKIEEHFAY